LDAELHGADPAVGASECMILEDATKTTALIKWTFEDISQRTWKQAQLRGKAL
jgi:hypothetical protein